VIEMLDSKGVYLHLLDANMDTSTAMGRCMVTIMLAFAQLNRDYARERTREVMAIKRENRDPLGRQSASAPVGWTRRGKKSRSYLVENEEERERVEIIAKWREEGLSYESIYYRSKGKEYGWKDSRQWVPRFIKAALEARDLGYPKVYIPTTKRIPAVSKSLRPAAAEGCEDLGPIPSPPL